MKDRCHNANSQKYRYYGERGIEVCAEWRNDFLAFREWALSAGYAPGLEIDRENNDGNYTPANCRWVTRRVNNQNRGPRNSGPRSGHGKLVNAFGEGKSLPDWARDPRCVVSYDTLFRRIHRFGWAIEKAITMPVNGNRGSGVRRKNYCRKGHPLVRNARQGVCRVCETERRRARKARQQKE